jgi:hypothetical protein
MLEPLFTFHERVVTLRTTTCTAATFHTTTVRLFRPRWGDTAFRIVRQHRRDVRACLLVVATMACAAALGPIDSPSRVWSVFGTCVASGWAAMLLYEFHARGDKPGVWTEIHSDSIAIDLPSVVDGTHNAAVVRVCEPVALEHNLSGGPIHLDKGVVLVLVSQMALRGSIFWDGYTVVRDATGDELIGSLRRTWQW